MGLSDLGPMVKEMHLKTITSDKLLPSTGFDSLGINAFKRKILFQRFYSGDRLYSRTKSHSSELNNIQSLRPPERGNSQGPPNKLSEMNAPNGHENQKSGKTPSETQRSRSTCRNQNNKPSATTTLWNMDICSMLGMSEEEIALSKESETKSDVVRPALQRAESLKQPPLPPPKTEPEILKIRVEVARGSRFGAYEALVARLRERGRTEFFKGGPGCAQSCRDVVKTNPVEEIVNQKLASLKYMEHYSMALASLRSTPGGSVSTCVFAFNDKLLLPPHEEDDCNVERLVVVSYGDAQFPGIRRDDGIFVRLADINNDALPGKDTRSLQSKCKRLDIQLHTCTDTELNLLVNFANSPQSKSHHMILVEDAQKLLESLFVDRRRRTR